MTCSSFSSSTVLCLPINLALSASPENKRTTTFFYTPWGFQSLSLHIHKVQGPRMRQREGRFLATFSHLLAHPCSASCNPDPLWFINYLILSLKLSLKSKNFVSLPPAAWRSKPSGAYFTDSLSQCFLQDWFSFTVYQWFPLLSSYNYRKVTWTTPLHLRECLKHSLRVHR